jgi:transposase InsO family protein
VRYACIEHRRDQYPVRMMCAALHVSRSGYYGWRTRKESERGKTDRELTSLIERKHEQSGGVYGSPRIRDDLIDEGYSVGRRRVARLMREAGLAGRPKRRFKVTTQRDVRHPVARNLLKQDFSAQRPNQVWASDITYVSTLQGWLYLAVVMDLYSRKIVGWSMDERMSRHLAIDALTMALADRQPAKALIHHSDRGAQYTSDDYRELLEQHGIQCSMSSRASCYDNAVVESFFGLMKRERAYRVRYKTRDQARADLFHYIEVFYNRKRRHGYLGNISPDDFERESAGLF